ncbi:MAG: ABC transporter permease [Flavobacteriales bacterium]|nr:ABC transporter permease [Flavobacteriales bacterium]|tara:strand:+ start:22277 stop:23293 length:1017 start_codon:yes stop_codon:yes gene_type:complete
MKTKTLYLILALIAFLVGIGSALFGAVSISLEEMAAAIQKWISQTDDLSLNEQIFLDIRLPRAVLGLIVGGSLAVGGVLMQGLFLNPIVEPGLVGTSSGAAFGAALYFTLGTSIDFHTGEFTLPIAASIGGAIATFLVYFLAESPTRKTSIVTLLLVGIAINALFFSGVGFLSYIARDPQARSITFWNLGTLSGANWISVAICSLVSLSCIVLGLRNAKQLNTLMLGESEAGNLGIKVKTLKIRMLTINVILISVCTAFTGVIAFVGLIVPHFLRIISGSDSRQLIIGSFMMGAILLGLADILARLLLAPAELPIGIVTTMVGVPVFIYLLRKHNNYF